MDYGIALSALADPTRRAVFEHLRHGPDCVGALASRLPVSRPAVSEHLKVLKQAGLVIDRPDGARRVYSINTDGLAQLRGWLEQFWDDALDAFRNEVESTSKPRGRKQS